MTRPDELKDIPALLDLLIPLPCEPVNRNLNTLVCKHCARSWRFDQWSAKDCVVRRQQADAKLSTALPAALNYIQAQDAKIAELERENLCDVCCGSGDPKTGMPCMCGGTGRASDAVMWLRTKVVELEREVEGLRADKYQRTILFSYGWLVAAFALFEAIMLLTKRAS